jgi:L-Ala-D/L-Glu epimerase
LDASHVGSPALEEIGVMRIRDVCVWSHALAERLYSESILLRVTMEDGSCGWGEALPRPYVTGETVAGCIAALRDRIVPGLAGLCLSDADALRSAILGLHDDPATGGDLAALCAIELALLDALARRGGQTLYDFVGRPPQVPSVTYSMVIGGGEKTTRKLSLFARLLGLQEVKIKAGPSLHANERLIGVVRRMHPRARLRVDANCAWTLEQARTNLAMMRGHGIVACEQPLAKEDVDGHARLTAEHPDMLIVADESLCSFTDARNLVEARAFSAFNIRISKNGGLFNALRIHALARDAGVVCQLGAQVGETALISAAGRILAGMAGDLRFCEGSFGTWLIKADVTRERVGFGLGGRASTRARGGGLGLSPVLSRVRRHAIAETPIVPVLNPPTPSPLHQAELPTAAARRLVLEHNG